MKRNLYTILDSAIGEHINPITIPSDRDAKEQFSMVVNDPQSQYFKHPQDYTLIQIAEFDTETGELKPLKKAKIICNASSLLNVQNKIIKASKPKTKK